MRIPNWVFQGVVPLLVVAVPIAWPLLHKEQQALHYEVVSVTPIGPTQARGFKDLTLYKGKKQIDNAYLATVRFVNAGDKEIEESDFAAPLTIRGGAGHFFRFFDLAWAPTWQGKPQAPLEFLDARVAGSQPRNIPVSITLSEKEVRIAPLLLNRGDEFQVEILLSGQLPGLVADARIRGVKALERIARKAKGDSPVGGTAQGVGYLMVGLALLGATTFVLLLMSPKKTVIHSLSGRPLWILGFVTAVIMASGAGLLLRHAIRSFDPEYTQFAYGVIIAVVAVLVAVGFYVDSKEQERDKT